MSARGRPRSQDADRAIVDATLAALAEVGYHRLSIQDVAARAGVSKATIYRRHPSKIKLVAAAARWERDGAAPQLDTGSFFSDLEALHRHALAMLNGSVWGRVLPGALSDGVDDPEVRAEIQRFFEWRIGAVRQMVARAVDRGEIRADTDPAVVYELLDGPILVRMFITGEPIDELFVTHLVSAVIDGVGLR